MSESATTDQTPQVADTSNSNAENTTVREPVCTRNASRATRPTNIAQATTPKDFQGATPKIGGILALRSENMTNKVNYNSFCEKLKIFIMNEFKGGKNVVEVTQNPSIDIISFFENDNKPEELTEEEKKSTIDREIKKEEIKDYVKDLKLMKSNLKKYTI